MESKLPVDTLGIIWDLADMDKDGQLDRHEFMVAMHLVYKALEKHTIPNVLPPELLPPGKRKPSQPNAAPAPAMPPAMPPAMASAPTLPSCPAPVAPVTIAPALPLASVSRNTCLRVGPEAVAK